MEYRHVREISDLRGRNISKIAIASSGRLWYSGQVADLGIFVVLRVRWRLSDWDERDIKEGILCKEW